MKGVWLLAAAGLLTWACGENDTPADSSSGSKTKECEDAMDCAAGETCSAAGECVRSDSGEPEGCSETVEVPWLREGNFWPSVSINGEPRGTWQSL
jgi:hypothetical protein